MTAAEDRDVIDAIACDVHEYLWEVRAIPTVSNVIQSLCTMGFMQWVKYPKSPECEMEGPSNGW